MKTFFIASVLTIFFCTAHAQDTTLKEYVGKYVFPEGSFVPDADVTLKDTVLNINSAQGASDLVKQSRDTFALAGYDGTAYFKRDSTGKIAGIKVQVQDLLVEGAKEADSSQTQQAPPAALPVKSAAKKREKKA